MIRGTETKIKKRLQVQKTPLPVAAVYEDFLLAHEDTEPPSLVPPFLSSVATQVVFSLVALGPRLRVGF